MLLALRMVDYVHVFDETDPIAFLEQIKPDVHVNGSEYGEDCIESDTVKQRRRARSISSVAYQACPHHGSSKRFS